VSVVRFRKRKTRVPKFRSDFEREFWDYNYNKIPLAFEPYKISYTVQEEKKYIPDFVVDPSRGLDGNWIVETKGYFTGSDRKKMLNVRRCNPSLNILLVFQRDNYLTPNKATRYSDWARKHNFDYCIGVDLSKTVRCANPNRAPFTEAPPFLPK